ncbi:MAG: Eco29kI family restriction endonuclease [Bacteroides sp.]|nr:Eco29kI family restriction endonuclease [Eubacterium sp.]MCM1418015.1 Eco29kI family restriction endonuclease [Roseburia sp.]MCM1462162.1 Eco29kI family restriction endonuclease [Bacteroides sp.]
MKTKHNDDIPVLTPYNPLNKRHLGEQVAEALLSEPIHILPPQKFIGAGIYALYYMGDFTAYTMLSKLNKDGKFLYPIYVGKAVPEGARKGGQGEDTEPGFALYKRLNDHAKSIEAAYNLNLSDFRCRFVAVDDIWIPLAESMMIERFKPVWNCLLEGFGNHAPGKGRISMMTPSWDWFHPGREWAKKLLPNSKSVEQLELEIQQYLSSLLKGMV